MTLTAQQQKDLLKRGFSRRSFAQLATLVAAGSTLPFYNEPAMAQLSKVDNMPPDAVIINANENPLGPCPEALEAVHKIAANGGRYLYGETDKVVSLLAQQEGLKENYIRIYPGSSAPLHQAVIGFCSPTKPFVAADPGYEAGGRAADFIGAKTSWVPLRKDFSHDVKAMAAVPNAGLIYICNPNNPTGTLTPRKDLEYILANKPKDAVLVIDEAYVHFSGRENMSTDLVKEDKDVVVLRTFSKIYGMAGLRAGAAYGRPDLIGKVREFGGAGFMRGAKCERIYREVKVNAIGGGTEEIMKDLASRQMGL